MGVIKQKHLMPEAWLLPLPCLAHTEESDLTLMVVEKFKEVKRLFLQQQRQTAPKIIAENKVKGWLFV